MKDKLLNEALTDINRSQSEHQLEDLRVKYLGRSGILTQQLKAIGNMSADDRKSAGAQANLQKQKITQAINEKKQSLLSQKLETDQRRTILDLTAPVNPVLGHSHPVITLLDELVQVFWQMGYQVIDGPEVETQWYNFEALNIPADHPARDMQDTFYLEHGNVPRTHTSNLQIRHMEQHQPPIRIVAPGKVYRNEDEDARHSWVFHQIEGLVVDKDISLADLKGTLFSMMKGVLGEDTQIRLRPSYFPYTEPSVEMDATCVICSGKGCRMCGHTGWLELGGAGMVHPQVLRNVGIDPTMYSGFAFGFGPERIAAVKHGVSDVREFWRPNLKFLEQFS